MKGRIKHIILTKSKFNDRWGAATTYAIMKYGPVNTVNQLLLGGEIPWWPVYVARPAIFLLERDPVDGMFRPN